MACIYWSITIKISLKAKQECPTANDEIKRNRKRRWHSAMLEMKKQGNIFLLDDVHWLSKSLWKLLDCVAVELAMIYHKNGRLAQTLFRAHLQSRTEHNISSDEIIAKLQVVHYWVLLLLSIPIDVDV